MKTKLASVLGLAVFAASFICGGSLVYAETGNVFCDADHRPRDQCERRRERAILLPAGWEGPKTFGERMMALTAAQRIQISSPNPEGRHNRDGDVIIHSVTARDRRHVAELLMGVLRTHCRRYLFGHISGCGLPIIARRRDKPSGRARPPG